MADIGEVVAVEEVLVAVAVPVDEADDNCRHQRSEEHINHVHETLFFAVVLLVVPATAAPAHADAFEQALSRGALRVGVASENFTPWLATDKEGARIGFEIDVATGVADALVLPAQFCGDQSKRLRAALKEKRFSFLPPDRAITFSCGIAEWEGMRYKEVYNIADRRIYCEKGVGEIVLFL
ncbi:hypothetical protein [Stappia indica]|uniref:hypothetical protein n=1 Tax=Stappia indica TaxID=538381 RepID=UPI001CD56006|nr:hypothetical protein [Stappia indica]MCA1300551.1 hypothetical protein [Stappia indica]